MRTEAQKNADLRKTGEKGASYTSGITRRRVRHRFTDPHQHSVSYPASGSLRVVLLIQKNEGTLNFFLIVRLHFASALIIFPTTFHRKLTPMKTDGVRRKAAHRPNYFLWRSDRFVFSFQPEGRVIMQDLFISYFSGSSSPGDDIRKMCIHSSSLFFQSMK